MFLLRFDKEDFYSFRKIPSYPFCKTSQNKNEKGHTKPNIKRYLHPRKI